MTACRIVWVLRHWECAWLCVSCVMQLETGQSQVACALVGVLIKRASNICTPCTLRTVSRETTSGRWFLWAAVGAGPNTACSCIGHRKRSRTRSFENAPFLLECLALCVNGYSAGWLLMKCVQNALCRDAGDPVFARFRADCPFCFETAIVRIYQI